MQIWTSPTSRQIITSQVPKRHADMEITERIPLVSFFSELKRISQHVRMLCARSFDKTCIVKVFLKPRITPVGSSFVVILFSRCEFRDPLRNDFINLVARFGHNTKHRYQSWIIITLTLHNNYIICDIDSRSAGTICLRKIEPERVGIFSVADQPKNNLSENASLDHRSKFEHDWRSISEEILSICGVFVMVDIRLRRYSKSTSRVFAVSGVDFARPPRTMQNRLILVMSATRKRKRVWNIAIGISRFVTESWRAGIENVSFFCFWQDSSSGPPPSCRQLDLCWQQWAQLVAGIHSLFWVVRVVI